MSNKRTRQDREGEEELDEEFDEAEEVLRSINPPQPTVEEQLRHVQHILGRLVAHYRINEYGSVVPLNLRCDGCHQPFLEDEDEEHPFDYFDNLSLCSGCVQLGQNAVAASKKKQKE